MADKRFFHRVCGEQTAMRIRSRRGEALGAVGGWVWYCTTCHEALLESEVTDDLTSAVRVAAPNFNAPGFRPLRRPRRAAAQDAGDLALKTGDLGLFFGSSRAMTQKG